jgi:hypothetical protein
MSLFNSKAKKRLEQHKKAIKELNGRKVEAGWFESARYKAGPRIPANAVGMSIAQVARINEFGTATIPARPAMRLAAATFNRDRNEIQAKIGKKVIEGKITPEQALGQIGLSMEGHIVDSIKNGSWPPNAKSTVKKKGFNAPLRDSGQMMKNVSSKVS